MQYYNPKTKRWVSAIGPTGRKLVETYGKKKLKNRNVVQRGGVDNLTDFTDFTNLPPVDSGFFKFLEEVFPDEKLTPANDQQFHAFLNTFLPEPPTSADAEFKRFLNEMFPSEQNQSKILNIPKHLREYILQNFIPPKNVAVLEAVCKDFKTSLPLKPKEAIEDAIFEEFIRKLHRMSYERHDLLPSLYTDIRNIVFISLFIKTKVIDFYVQYPPFLVKLSIDCTTNITPSFQEWITSNLNISFNVFGVSQNDYFIEHVNKVMILNTVSRMILNDALINTNNTPRPKLSRVGQNNNVRSALVKFNKIACKETTEIDYLNIVKSSINFQKYKDEFAWMLFTRKTNIVKQRLQIRSNITNFVISVLINTFSNQIQMLQYTLIKHPDGRITESYIVNRLSSNNQIEERYLVDEPNLLKKVVSEAFQKYHETKLLTTRARRIFLSVFNIFSSFMG